MTSNPGSASMQAQIIFNPMAGRFPSQTLVERAAEVFQKQGWDINLVRSASQDQFTRKIREAVDNDLDVVLVAGGDGSINKAASELLGKRTALGVLPAGTANVWAQEVGLPVLSWTNLNALEKSARMLVNGVIRTVDVGLCGGTPFLLWAGIGLDGFIVHHLEPRSKLEKQFAELQYAANLAWYASRWEGMELEIWADGECIKGTYVLALVSNIGLYAGGYAQVSPGARIDDGVMELWLFSGDSLAEIVQHVWAVISGTHQKSTKVKGVQCREINISSSAELYLQVDGDPLPAGEEVQIAIQPESLRVLIPEQIPRPLFSED